MVMMMTTMMMMMMIMMILTRRKHVLLASCLFNAHAAGKVYLMNGSVQIVSCAGALRQAVDQTRISPTHNILTLG